MPCLRFPVERAPAPAWFSPQRRKDSRRGLIRQRGTAGSQVAHHQAVDSVIVLVAQRSGTVTMGPGWPLHASVISPSLVLLLPLRLPQHRLPSVVTPISGDSHGHWNHVAGSSKPGSRPASRTPASWPWEGVPFRKGGCTGLGCPQHNGPCTCLASFDAAVTQALPNLGCRGAPGISSRKEPVSPGWSDTPKSHPHLAPDQAEAVSRQFPGQALA